MASSFLTAGVHRTFECSRLAYSSGRTSLAGNDKASVERVVATRPPNARSHDWPDTKRSARETAVRARHGGHASRHLAATEAGHDVHTRLPSGDLLRGLLERPRLGPSGVSVRSAHLAYSGLAGRFSGVSRRHHYGASLASHSPPNRTDQPFLRAVRPIVRIRWDAENALAGRSAEMAARAPVCRSVPGIVARDRDVCPVLGQVVSDYTDRLAPDVE